MDSKDFDAHILTDAAQLKGLETKVDQLQQHVKVLTLEIGNLTKQVSTMKIVLEKDKILEINRKIRSGQPCSTFYFHSQFDSKI